MAQKGVLVSINVSPGKGTPKTPVESATVTPRGLEGDAHAGDWHRQVSLLGAESIDRARPGMAKKGFDPGFGDFAENLTTRGIDWSRAAVGHRIRVGGEVELELTQVGKECHSACAVRERTGDCIMPREGIFARVIRGGAVRRGDPVEVTGPVGQG